MLLWSFRVVFIGLILGFFVVHGYIIGDPCSAPVFSSPNTIGPCRNHTLACDPDLQLCVLRGCRSEEFSANWPQNWQLPPLCNKDTEYCPDSQLKCQPKIKMGDICSPGRDDSCDTSQGICLNQRCNA
ncbi:Trihydroxynaphthalene reductase, partial [Basidiobolus ranarum]